MIAVHLSWLSAERVTACGTVALALVAIAAAVIAWMHRGIVVVDLYLRLMDRVETEPVAAAQRRLREALGRGEEAADRDVRLVLNALEIVALAVKKKMVTLEMVWNAQGDRILFYWFGCNAQIRAVRDPDETIWENLAWLVDCLRSHNKKLKVPWGDGAPTRDEVRKYFAAELPDLDTIASTSSVVGPS